MSDARVAGDADLPAVAQMLVDFNTEYDEITPPVKMLTLRLAHLIHETDTAVLIVGDGPDGLAVLRFRRALWTPGKECYLAELYVRPEKRNQGIGHRLMEFAMDYAKSKNADSMDIGVDGEDSGAARFYESLGFSNKNGDDTMFVFEKEL